MSQNAKIRFSKAEKVLLILMAAIQFSHIVDFMIMMPLGDLLMKLFAISPKEFGLLVSSYTLAAGISGFAASFFIDRFDRKSALLFFSFGFTIGTLACAAAPNYPMLLLARSLTGVFGGVLGSLVLAIVSDAFAYERRGTAMGIVMGSFSLASIFGVPFSLKLADMYSWHAPFLFLGGSSAVVLVASFFLLSPMRGHLTGGVRHAKMESLLHILRTPNQQIALFFMFCLMLGQFTIIPFLSPSFIANGGMTQAELPMVYLFGGLCAMFASPLAGRMADRFGKHVVFVTSAVVSMVPIYFITHLNHSPIWLLLLVSSGLFITMSGRMVPAMAMVSSTATPEYRGSFMSVSSAVQQLSAALASYVAGMIILKGEGGALLHYDVVGYIAMVFSVLAIFAALRIHRGDAQSSQPVER